MDNNEILRVYRLRNKKTGRFEDGGHASNKGIYTRIQSAVSSFRLRLEGKTDWWGDREDIEAADYEIVEYDLVESGIHPIHDRGSSNS